MTDGLTALVVVVDERTVNIAEAESPVDPDAVIVYAPAATLATTKEALNVPPETLQVDVLTGLPNKEHAVSLMEKPEPETRTVAPTRAEVGLSVIDAVERMTVRVTDAESPVDPDAVIV